MSEKMTTISLLNRWRLWRVRPGIELAAKLAQQTAWRHQNAGLLGPERNLIMFSLSLRDRLLNAGNGDISGLCLDPLSPQCRGLG